MTRLRTCILGLAGLAATIGAADAQTFQQEHPRRAEVVGRLGNENARIDAGRREGELSPGQARRLRGEDRAIHAEERADARLNGGRITRGEQRQLNRQENRLSRQIHQGRAL